MKQFIKTTVSHLIYNFNTERICKAMKCSVAYVFPISENKQFLRSSLFQVIKEAQQTYCAY